MVERDEVRRGYDALAETYDDHRSANGRGVAILGSFLESLPAAPRVLDAGCGAGSPGLSRIDADGGAVGLDVSRRALDIAAGEVPGAALAQGDMTHLPFEDDAFDGVVALWSLIHVPLADHGTVLEEFARVLRPGGRALVCEGTDEWVGRNPDWLDSGVEMAWAIAGAGATRAQLVDAGFEVTGTWGVPETLEDEAADGEATDGEATEDDAEPAWTFFEARLEG